MAQLEAESKVLKATEFVTVSELATMMNIQVTQIISACMSLGMMVTMNQRLDAETLSIVAEEFGFEVEFVTADIEEGKGDVDAYFAKAEAYFAGYKWDHKGHTNSFSQLMNTDIVIREQDGYLKQTGGSWSKDSVPPSGTPKAKILEGYLQNAERCIQKESMGKFNEMDLATREEWKAIVCTQGLVAPADDQ